MCMFIAYCPQIKLLFEIGWIFNLSLIPLSLHVLKIETKPPPSVASDFMEY